MKWGVLGLLVGDALGVPYEFTLSDRIPPADQIEFEPPKGFKKTYPKVPAGTWSDDGAQALCVLDAMLNAPEDMRIETAVGQRLLRWRHEGFMAVDSIVFDVGITTNNALTRLAQGVPATMSGMTGEQTMSNGSLMRALPVALYDKDDDVVRAAIGQSRVTHAESLPMICCAFYCLWAKYTALEHPQAWEAAYDALYEALPKGVLKANAQFVKLWKGPLTGDGYVLDSLHSAKIAVEGSTDFESAVRRAIQFGNDTDTTAAIAGGIAGIKYQSIPQRWLDGLRGREILNPILDQLRAWNPPSSTNS